MKKLIDVTTSEIAEAINTSESFVSQCRKPESSKRFSAEHALVINEKFGIPLWEIRPDVYPRHLFPKCKQGKE